MTEEESIAGTKSQKGRRFLQARFLQARLPALGIGFLELAVVVACLLVVTYSRLLNLEEIEVGGDALKVWEFARGLVYGGDLPDKFDHHTSRFGIVLPVMFVQAVWGAQATSYYLAPLGAAVLLHLFVYLVGRKLHGPPAGAFAVILLLGFEPMIRPSSQVLPESFGPMFAMFAVYMALLATDRGTTRLRMTALVLTAFGIFWAYAAKIVYLYYAPGIAFLVWFGGPAQASLIQETVAPDASAGRVARAVFWARKRGLLIPGVLTLSVLVLLLIDTILMTSVSSSGGRFDVLSKTHGVIKDPRKLRIAADFFALYVRAPIEWQQALWVGALAMLGVAAFSPEKRARLFALMLFVYFLLQTFVVRKLNPITPWTEPHPRYLLAMAAPIAVLVGGFIADSTSSILFSLPRLRIAELERRWTRLLLLLLALIVLLPSASDLSSRWKKEWGRRTAWHQTKKEAQQLTAAFEAGIPIISTTPQGKPAWAAGALLIHPDALLVNGKLLNHSSFKRKQGVGRYLARAVNDPNISKRRLDNVVEERRRKGDCVITINQRFRFMQGRLTYDSRCESLEETFRKDPNAGKKTPRKKNASRSRRKPSRAAD